MSNETGNVFKRYWMDHYLYYSLFKWYYIFTVLVCTVLSLQPSLPSCHRPKRSLTTVLFPTSPVIPPARSNKKKEVSCRSQRWQSLLLIIRNAFRPLWMSSKTSPKMVCTRSPQPSHPFARSKWHSFLLMLRLVMRTCHKHCLNCYDVDMCNTEATAAASPSSIAGGKLLFEQIIWAKICFNADIYFILWQLREEGKQIKNNKWGQLYHMNIVSLIFYYLNKRNFEHFVSPYLCYSFKSKHSEAAKHTGQNMMHSVTLQSSTRVWRVAVSLRLSTLFFRFICGCSFKLHPNSYSS